MRCFRSSACSSSARRLSRPSSGSISSNQAKAIASGARIAHHDQFATGSNANHFSTINNNPAQTKGIGNETPKGVPTVQQRDRGVRRGRPDGVRGRSGGSVRASSHGRPCVHRTRGAAHRRDRKSTRLNSSHVKISYAVFCLKKKKKNIQDTI